MSHGGSGGTENTLTLGAGEYITSMEAHWGKKDDHTRVFYLNFVTSAGNSISGGTQTDDKATAIAPDGFQLAGFYGRAEDEVDQLGAIWTRISAVDLSLTDEEASSGSGILYGTTIRNWVGPTIGDATDTACYRKTESFDSNNKCPLGYGKEDSDCIAQCPLAYPVACSLECIPQNDDCALEVLTKIGSVVTVALNAATAGVFGDILAVYKAAKWAITCASNIVSVVRSLIYYMRYQQTAAPQGDTDELLAVAYQADVVLIDLPVAVCACLGLPVPAGAKYADTVLTIVEGIVKQAITNGDEIISTGQNVLNLLTGTGALSSTTVDSTTDELQDLIDTNSTCGYELKRLTDRVVSSVLEIRNNTPDATLDSIRVSISRSSLVLNDIPTVTNNCMRELLTNKTKEAAFETRDLLRKTFGVIIDQLIDTGTTDLGENVAEDEYMLKVANMGLVVLSTIDPTGIAYMASQFVQPICGPTAFLGEIDDGTLYDALGLTTVDEAFEGSYGTWTKSGDGVVHLILESTDTEDVTVVIHSGGDKDVNAARNMLELFKSGLKGKYGAREHFGEVASTTMATVAEVFSGTCSDDTDRCVGGEYKEAARRIERDVAERMEQSVRFTVLDPLRDRLERHTVLQEQICVRDNLATECKALRALVQRLPTLRLEDDDKRVQTYSRLDKVIGELKEVEKKLLPLLEDAIQSDSTSSTENLFNAMVR
ncbi:hypothetical protein G195_004513 [Phytophthora kernoviae 00238/432]|nr:hypothetical protein G195_004513 [Phytophthora kernoviae 00238/432]